MRTCVEACKIELGFDGNRIGESNVATLQRKADAVESGFTFENVDAAEDRRTGHGAAKAQVGIAGKAGDRGSHLKFGRGRTWTSSLMLFSGELAGNGGELPAALEIGAEIEIPASRPILVILMSPETVEAGAAADPMQFRVRSGTNPRRITQANIFAAGAEIEIDLLIKVGGVAAQVERAASRAGR